MAEFVGAWEPDVLSGYESAPCDTVTLVRPMASTPTPRFIVLHVHGYNDYFFQDHLARAFIEAGNGFYAVDLARAGRSLRPGDVPHYMDDIADQGHEIELAVNAIALMHPGVQVIVHGHSTGALSAALWAGARPHPSVAGLVLNSPLLGAVLTRRQRLLSHALPLAAALRPMAIVAESRSVYAQHQHVGGGGRWLFDLAWKRPAGVPIRAGWADATRHAQSRVRHHLGIQVPVLVARSDSSGPDRADNPMLDRQDTVVDVASIAHLAPLLGEHVEHVVIAGGVHDLSLSQDEPRARYFESVMAWIDSVGP